MMLSHIPASDPTHIHLPCSAGIIVLLTSSLHVLMSKTTIGMVMAAGRSMAMESCSSLPTPNVVSCEQVSCGGLGLDPTILCLIILDICWHLSLSLG